MVCAFEQSADAHNDFDVGVEGLDGKGDASDQTAAANWNDNGVDVRHLLHHFQSQGALAGHYVWVVIAGKFKVKFLEGKKYLFFFCEMINLH
jgi:hypothetical protein